MSPAPPSNGPADWRHRRLPGRRHPGHGNIRVWQTSIPRHAHAFPSTWEWCGGTDGELLVSPGGWSRPREDWSPGKELTGGARRRSHPYPRGRAGPGHAVRLRSNGARAPGPDGASHRGGAGLRGLTRGVGMWPEGSLKERCSCRSTGCGASPRSVGRLLERRGDLPDASAQIHLIKISHLSPLSEDLRVARGRGILPAAYEEPVFIQQYTWYDLWDIQAIMKEASKKRETDGYYYPGHIAREVKGSRERFLIEFDKSCAWKGKVQLRLQETPLYDILHYEDAGKQRLAPGDRVLAPWEAAAERFGPGTVLRVVENKEARLVVEPQATTDTVTQTWTACRGGLYSTHPCTKCSWGCIPAWEPTCPTGCKVQQENAFIPGTRLTEEELSKKIEEELSELRITSSKSVSREEEEKEETRLETANVQKYVWSCLEDDNDIIEPEKGPQRELAHAVVDTTVNTDSWLLETDHKKEPESRQQDADTGADFKEEHGLFESRVAEAPVQHPQRSPSLRTSALVPFRCQSFFDQVNQSLEKDSLTIKSALRVQRPHVLARKSTKFLHLLKDKSIKKSILNGAFQERGKEMDFDRAKIEHKRWQEEQRQLKREQQQKADGIRCQLRRDSQRQRLRQRTLQGLEKQLEHKKRALQHMALLQASGAERSRKESFSQEEEKRKAGQRLQFLKTQHLQREKLQAECSERSFEHEKERLEFLRSRMQSRQEMLEQESREQDKQQNQHHAAKVRVFQSRDRLHHKMEKDLQQYLREQNLLLLWASLLA
ncbi:uncharacterized protein [Pithys albifrons albifrons]|uniref:uncharacterized protein n=1 Tax=Pithys albifrons albifrons TaxID=3385563 RepID=UPI003A5D0D28